MSFTYTPGTAIYKVRQRIPDTVDFGHRFEDAELQSFLDDNDDSVNLAAADAIDSLANLMALAPKKVESLDGKVEMNDPQALTDRAQHLREIEDDDGDIEIAELVTNPWSAKERIDKQSQRGII